MPACWRTSASAWAGLVPPRPSPVDATVTLLGDPADAGGAVRALGKLGTRHVELSAAHRAAAPALDDDLAAALSAALVDSKSPAPAPAPMPAPAFFDQTPAAPAPAAAPPTFSAPTFSPSVPVWVPGEDDILPRGVKAGAKKKK